MKTGELHSINEFQSPVLAGDAEIGEELDAGLAEEESFCTPATAKGLETRREADGYGRIYAVYL